MYYISRLFLIDVMDTALQYCSSHANKAHLNRIERERERFFFFKSDPGL